MTNEKKNELIGHSTCEYAVRRLREGIKQLISNPRKGIGIVIIMALALLFILMAQHTVQSTVLKLMFGVITVPITVVTLLCFVIACGTPRGAYPTHNNLTRIGLANSAGEVPFLLKVYPYRSKATYRQVFCLEFLSCGIAKSIWEKQKESIEASLNLNIAKIEEFDGKRGIRLYVVPADQGLDDKILWRNILLNTEIPVCKIILGESLLEPVVVDLNITPHMLIGGGTGSGKTVLLRLILMQLLKKKNVQVTIADFKGGVDYSASWQHHPKCKMIFDRTELLSYLDALIDELNRRKKLFASKENCNNIVDYNENLLYTHNQSECLDRIVFAADEVAEILDKTGLDKAAKEQVAQIESRIATIARLGRAVGIHLLLATQRPDANILSGQIKNNIAYRVCGRADNVLSMIILDSTAAADEIPADARGRFIDSNGTVFQGYYLEDSQIDWEAQI